MKYDRILIDVSNLYFRAYCVNKHLSAEVDGELLSTGGIYTVIRMINRIRDTYLSDGGRIFYLFDNATSSEQRRKNIDPMYKVNRSKQDPVFYRGLDYMYMVLQVFQDNDRLIRKPGSEADDLVSPVLRSFNGKEYKILLISNDRDWSRSLSKNVHWMVRDFSTKQDIVYTVDSFTEKFGFVPSIESVCLFKAIKGDVSDNIPIGIKNISTELVLNIISKVSSIDDLYNKIEYLGLSDKWKFSFLENKGRVLLNYRLVSFQDLSIDEVREFTEISHFNKSVLKTLYNSLKFVPEKLDERFKDSIKEPQVDDFFDAEKFPRA